MGQSLRPDCRRMLFNVAGCKYGARPKPSPSTPIAARAGLRLRDPDSFLSPRQYQTEYKAFGAHLENERLGLVRDRTCRPPRIPVHNKREFELTVVVIS